MKSMATGAWVWWLGVVVCVASISAGCARSPATAPPGPAVVRAVAGGARSAEGPTNGRKVIKVRGSDTLLEVARAWAAAYCKQVPDAKIVVEGGGSATGFQALAEGTADIADASERITDEAVQACRFWGFKPQEYGVGYDGIVIVVHKSNPIEKLTVEQLSDMYSGKVTDWSALTTHKGEIVLLSRDPTSGTYAYFKEHVIRGGQKSTRDYAVGAIKLTSNSQIRDKVAENPDAVGYIGLGYLNETVKAVPVVDKWGRPTLPTAQDVKAGVYPISRPLFVYTREDANREIRAYVEWILGDAGQRILAQHHFAPLK
jgi:phosphate transport system substrate-binding protein